MIINTQFPNKSLYIIGAQIIDLISNNIQPSIGVILLHDKYEENIGIISYPYFIYTLDWLFIIDAIKLNENGDLELCN